MNAIDPRIDPRLVPEGSRASVFAKDGKTIEGSKVDPLPSVRTPDGKVITRWQLTDEERAAIVRGEDVFLTIWSFGPINPVYLSVGPCNWTSE